MPTIRVVLADDHALVRSGIRSLLQAMPEIEVVGEAGNGRAALQLVEQHQPDVVLMDIAMPEVSGLEAAERITEEFPEVRIIILSMYTNEEYVSKALHAGAAGYLLKDSATVELELAIKAIAQGHTYLSPAVSRHLVAEHVQRGQQSDQADPLTPRQREILHAIAQGYTTHQIAHKLSISVKTVETHRTQLMGRLGIHDIAGLVRYAIRIGLITSDI